jgi:hypothetical protein
LAFASAGSPYLLLSAPGSYALDALVASGLVPLAAPAPDVLRSLGLPAYSCPYGLPIAAEGRGIIVVSSWLQVLEARGANRLECLGRLSERFGLVGVDQADPFRLDLSDAECRTLRVLAKVNGTYRDSELYGFAVGAGTPDGSWTRKIQPGARYAAENLEKLRTSVPCFIGTIPWLRRRTRPFYRPSFARRVLAGLGDQLAARHTPMLDPQRPPPRTIHFRGSLTHVQRLDALRRLAAARVSWAGGLTAVPSVISGFGGFGLGRPAPAERSALEREIRGEGLWAPAIDRFRYLREIASCKAVLSIAGYGEVCFRMAEAWAARRVLVCQDLSHVRTLYPLEPGRNVVYCRPDLDDLPALARDIEERYPHYAAIAEQGHRDWLEWSRDPVARVREGFGPALDLG